MGNEARDFIEWLRDQGYEVCRHDGDWYLSDPLWYPVARRELEDLLVEYEGGVIW